MVGMSGSPARLRKKIMQSYPGMAHTAGSGPEGKSCRQCARWGEYGVEYFSDGRIKPHACQRFVNMMGHSLKGVPPRIPHHALACRFFIQVREDRPIKKRDMYE